MTDFIEGENRLQSTLFPERLDDYTAENNAVRVIDGEAIRLVCRSFVMLCRKLNLFTDAFAAIDGSKFKAVNNRDKNFTKVKLKGQLRHID